MEQLWENKLDLGVIAFNQAHMHEAKQCCRQPVLTSWTSVAVPLQILILNGSPVEDALQMVIDHAPLRVILGSQPNWTQGPNPQSNLI